MATVALIVTGDLERIGLPHSLGRLFPHTTFHAQQVDCFTTAPVKWPPARRTGLATAVEKYTTALIAALQPGRRDPKPDFVYGIEDLELANRHQPAEVIRVFREAVAAELNRRGEHMAGPKFDALQEAVRDRCSFHLLAPMLEAYFFASDAALRAAGCTRLPGLVAGRDVETLEIADGGYLAAPEKSATWAVEGSRRPYHPKHYLAFLLHPAGYRETVEGARALAALDCDQVLAQQNQPCFLSSLFQDLGDGLGLDRARFAGLGPIPLK